MNLSRLKKLAIRSMELEKKNIFKLSNYINSNPETAYCEIKAALAITSYLNDKGFVIKKPLAGLSTAFLADFGLSVENNFPVALIAEYDALEEIGHGCGHNLIAAAAAAAAIGVAAAIKEVNKGAIRLIGSPAEEILTEPAGKNRLLEAGIFKNTHACLMFHPWIKTGVALNDFGCKSYKVVFAGRSAHAAADPWNSLNALDAAVIFYNSISMYRQQLPPQSRLHCIVTDGGKTINVIPSHSSLEVMIRSTQLDLLNGMESRIKDCAKAAAISTGCSCDFEQIASVKPILFNKELFDIAANNMKQLEEDLKTIPVWQASSDFGDVSHEIPSLSLLYKTHSADVNWHSKEVAQASGEDFANEAMFRASKVLALTAIDLVFREYVK